MARGRRTGRDVHGILVLDKPIGRSSNHVLQHVKRLFQAKKAGHTGSLDPLATGVLPICFGHATKVSSFLLDSDKSYHFEMTLGVTTSTGDSEGDILQTRDVPPLDEGAVIQVLTRFMGQIEQVPPMYSALKHQGQPLYKLARAGGEVERPARRVTIHGLSLLQRKEAVLRLEVRCSKGTYVRSLAEDIGVALGCGAHVSQLRRIKAGPFGLEQSVTLEELEMLQSSGLGALDACLNPVDAALSSMPRVDLSPDQALQMTRGQALEMGELPNHDVIRLYQAGVGLIGIGKQLEDGRLAPRRIL